MAKLFARPSTAARAAALCEKNIADVLKKKSPLCRAMNLYGKDLDDYIRAEKHRKATIQSVCDRGCKP